MRLGPTCGTRRRRGQCRSIDTTTTKTTPPTTSDLQRVAHVGVKLFFGRRHPGPVARVLAAEADEGDAVAGDERLEVEPAARDGSEGDVLSWRAADAGSASALRDSGFALSEQLVNVTGAPFGASVNVSKLLTPGDSGRRDGTATPGSPKEAEEGAGAPSTEDVLRQAAARAMERQCAENLARQRRVSVMDRMRAARGASTGACGRSGVID